MRESARLFYALNQLSRFPPRRRNMDLARLERDHPTRTGTSEHEPSVDVVVNVNVDVIDP